MKDNTVANPEPKKPNSHLVMAIITTILPLVTCTFFSLPAGIVSIVFASKVNPRFNSGNIEKAQESSKYAKIAWIVALAILLAQIILVVLTVTFSDDSFLEEIKKEMEKQKSLQN